MPATSFHEHVRGIQGVLDATIAAGEAALVSIQIDQRSSLRGSVVGLLRFHDASELHFQEYIDTSRPEARLMYAYHYQDAIKDLIFRYHNAPHRPALSEAAHKHTPGEVRVAPAPTLAQIIDEIMRDAKP